MELNSRRSSKLLTANYPLSPTFSKVHTVKSNSNSPKNSNSLVSIRKNSHLNKYFDQEISDLSKTNNKKKREEDKTSESYVLNNYIKQIKELESLNKSRTKQYNILREKCEVILNENKDLHKVLLDPNLTSVLSNNKKNTNEKNYINSEIKNRYNNFNDSNRNEGDRNSYRNYQNKSSRDRKLNNYKYYNYKDQINKINSDPNKYNFYENGQYSNINNRYFSNSHQIPSIKISTINNEIPNRENKTYFENENIKPHSHRSKKNNEIYNSVNKNRIGQEEYIRNKEEIDFNKYHSNGSNGFYNYKRNEAQGHMEIPNEVQAHAINPLYIEQNIKDNKNREMTHHLQPLKNNNLMINKQHLHNSNKNIFESSFEENVPASPITLPNPYTHLPNSQEPPSAENLDSTINKNQHFNNNKYLDNSENQEKINRNKKVSLTLEDNIKDYSKNIITNDQVSNLNGRPHDLTSDYKSYEIPSISMNTDAHLPTTHEILTSYYPSTNNMVNNNLIPNQCNLSKSTNNRYLPPCPPPAQLRQENQYLKQHILHCEASIVCLKKQTKEASQQLHLSQECQNEWIKQLQHLQKKASNYKQHLRKEENKIENLINERDQLKEHINLLKSVKYSNIDFDKDDHNDSHNIKEKHKSKKKDYRLRNKSLMNDINDKKARNKRYSHKNYNNQSFNDNNSCNSKSTDSSSSSKKKK